MTLDIDFVRRQFPALSGDWIYFDNAGGTQTVRQVGQRLSEYLYQTNVQLGASYEISQSAGQRVRESQSALAKWINAFDPSEIILGPSTTQLLQNLSKSLGQMLKPGDEVIVTNCDHEANIGPWLDLKKLGIIVKVWKIRPETLRLHSEDLKILMGDKTRLVAFTHVSNVIGTIHPVKEIVEFIHRHGAMVCVDGVAYVPHRKVDVKELDVDFYVFSLYKVYGPHYSLLYGKRDHLLKLPGINHFFIKHDDIPYKLQPGHVNFELSYSLLGVLDYFRLLAERNVKPENQASQEVDQPLFQAIAEHEEKIASLLLDYLNVKKGIRIIGERTADRNIRVPTISFISDHGNSDEVVTSVDLHRIGIRYGDFYARRLIEDLGLASKNGVIRVSMVHYNTIEEVRRLIEVLDKILP